MTDTRSHSKKTASILLAPILRLLENLHLLGPPHTIPLRRSNPRITHCRIERGGEQGQDKVGIRGAGRERWGVRVSMDRGQEGGWGRTVLVW